MERTTKAAAQVAEAAAPHAERHDREGSFVSEGVEAALQNGYLASPVPVELGGDGALASDIAEAQRVIARVCGSTALVCSMHLHVLLAAAWRWRRGDTVVEPMLRKVASERIFVVSTGGRDWTHPSTIATPADGGWILNGRKTFASGSPAGTVMATFGVVGEPAPGAEVIAFGCPLSADGVRLEETWDAVGMRGTASHDIVMEDVFVAEGQVTGRRTWGELDRPLLVASLQAWPVVYGTYLGLADGLVGAALERLAASNDRARLVGLADARLRTARWALEGALSELGEDPDPTVENYVTTQQMKTVMTEAFADIARSVAELAGGGAYARRSDIDRMTRDLGAAVYHPYPPEQALTLVGRVVLGEEPL